LRRLPIFRGDLASVDLAELHQGPHQVEELGRPVRLGAGGGGGQSSRLLSIPPMKLRDFTFTSISDAV
jgi:hypothetical protein